MIYEKVKDIILDEIRTSFINEEEIFLDVDFKTLGFSVLELLELQLACEDEFDIQIDDKELTDTIQDLVNEIESKI